METGTVTKLPVPAQPERSVAAELAERYGMTKNDFASVVRATCMPPNATAHEFLAFLMVAKAHNLNPVLREIYAFPKKGGGIVPIVSIDGWANLINSHPQLDGVQFDINNDEQGKLVSITCRIFRKDRKVPTEITEFLDECIRATEPWKMQRRMLRHKALIQCARYAFGFSGIYDEDEGARIAEIAAPAAVRSSEPPPAPPATIEHQPTETAGAAVAPVEDAGGGEKPVAPRDKTAPASEPIEDAVVDDEIFDGDAKLQEVEENLSTAMTPVDVDEVIALYEEDLSRLSRSQREKYEHLIEVAQKRVAPKDNSGQLGKAPESAEPEAQKSPQEPVQADGPPPAPSEPEGPPPAPAANPEPAAAGPDPFAIPARGSITTQEAYEAYIDRAIAAATTEEHVPLLQKLWKDTAKHRSEDVGRPVAESVPIRKRVAAKVDELERAAKGRK